MVDKQFVSMSVEGKVALYRAQISKTVLFARLIRDLMYRVLEMEGAVPQDVYVNSKLLSDDELDELHGLL